MGYQPQPYEQLAAYYRRAGHDDGERHVAVVPAQDLAERYWDMYLKRDRVEEEVTPGLAASAVRAEDAR